MRALVIANWKMNPSSLKEAKKLFDATKKAVDTAKSVQVVVAPPSIFLGSLAEPYRGKRISFALQDAHWDASGAHTGDVSLIQGKDARASHVIVGHSERRARGETNEDTGKVVAAALALKMTPILCIGEKTRTASGEHLAFVKEQLLAGLTDVAPSSLARIIIAYEPVWAIGKETTMSPRDMHEMAIFIRKTIVEVHGAPGMNVKILYGAAATENNAVAMLTDGDVAGLLVGHVSVEPMRFARLLEAINNAPSL